MQLLNSWTNLSIFSFFYFLVYTVIFLGSASVLTFLGIRGNFEMDEDFKHSETTSAEGILIHELFLVFRYIALGLAILQFLSYFFYAKLVLCDGPCLCGARMGELRPIRDPGVAPIDTNDD